MAAQPEFAKFNSIIRPWKEEAIKRIKTKYPQLLVKGGSLAAGLIVKYCRTKFILLNCSKVAFGISKTMQGTIIAQS
jgi:hypothetical protein